MSQFSFEQFQKIVGEQLGVDSSKALKEARLIEDLGADSIAMVNIVAEVEAALDKDLEDLDFDDVVTVNDAYQLMTAG